MRWIYLSPHFDDAVLSCGGLIWEQTHSGIPVEIWTINAGDPPEGDPSDLIIRVHAMWKTGTPQETVIQRRIEDQNAANQVGARTRHFDMVDAIYRRNETGSLIYPLDVFAPIHPCETGIVQETALKILQEIDESDTLVCPLALGGHVDHTITRAAVESLYSRQARAAGLANRTRAALWYYADVPYLFKHETELAPAVKDLRPKNFFISNQGLAAWLDGVSAHKSQISSLFVDLEDMRAQIKAYRLSRSGQTLWEKV